MATPQELRRTSSTVNSGYPRPLPLKFGLVSKSVNPERDSVDIIALKEQVEKLTKRLETVERKLPTFMWAYFQIVQVLKHLNLYEEKPVKPN